MGIIQSAVLSGPFDAVMPLHLNKIFGFDALEIGAMFAALAVPEVILGPVAGWIVDNYGSKLAGLIGFTLLCPGMCLLVLPRGPASTGHIGLFVGLLLVAGYFRTYTAG
jgi:nitrate/nitrite transporter NarK